MYRAFLILFLSGFLYAHALVVDAQSRAIPLFISYLHPRPSSQLVSNQSTILLRLNPTSGIHRNDIQFEVVGSQSGNCAGEKIYSDDLKTIIFRPHNNFIPGETISVTIREKNRPLFSYQFSISGMSQSDKQNARLSFTDLDHIAKELVTVPKVGTVRSINGITVPSDFPEFKIQEYYSDNIAPGYLFFGLRGAYVMMLNNDGTPYFFEKSNDFLMDFKVQPNGMLSRLVDDWSSGERFFALLDNQFSYVDSFMVQGDYETDHHDFQYLPNGHVLLIAGDYQKIDMSQIVAGGDPNARVRGCHIQELDQHKNVVFQWNCWDDIPITDAVFENLQASSIDYVHMNSVALDYDGHILASCRNTSQCIKVNRHTGELMWVLGGVQSSFQFINDPDQNSYQHHFRAVPDNPNHYTFFDNGNKKDPPYSRAVEFKIDTTNWTAERVWQFRPASDYKASWLGSVQRLPNGNTLINWTGGNLPLAMEVTPDGEVVYQARHKKNFPCYRTFRFDWRGVAAEPRLFIEAEDNRVVLIFHKFGDKNVKLYKIYHGLSKDDLSLYTSTMDNRLDIENLLNYRRHYFKVVAVDKSGRESEASEVRSVEVKYVEENVNIIQNGDFSNGSSYWHFEQKNGAQALGFVSDGEFKIQINNGGAAYDDISLSQTGLPLYQDKTYLFEFEAYAESPRAIDAKVADRGELLNYGSIGFTALTKIRKQYSYSFKMKEYTTLDAKVVFNCGGNSAAVFIDNVSLRAISETEVAFAEKKAVENFVLLSNYPNPFNSSTMVRFYVPSHTRVELDILNIRGERVARLKNETLDKGAHVVIWDGTNENGLSVSSGLYFCRLKTGSTFNVTKLLVAR
jgi:hypothetical protein